MINRFGRSLCVSLALSLAITPILPAQQLTVSGPIPAQIASAHTIFVSNGGGSNYFDGFTGGADRGYNSLYADLRQWNRYQFAATPAEADLVIEIRSVAPVASAGGEDVTYNPQLILRVLDPKTNTVLWTTSANVRAFGRQKTRDREFDQSLSVVVDKLAEVSGQTLTPAQMHEVRANSHMPRAAKVFLAVGIATAVALSSYGIYRVTHPPTLTIPSIPATR